MYRSVSENRLNIGVLNGLGTHYNWFQTTEGVMGGNRFSSRAGAFSGTVLIAAVAYGTAAHAAAAPPDLSGTYWATEYHAKIQVADWPL